MKELEFIPLKNLVLEDNEKSKEIQSLYGKEVEYLEFLGPLEYFIARSYMNNKSMRDADVVRALKNIKANYDKNLDFFKTEIEEGIAGTMSLALQNARRKITKHELTLVFGHILWSIKNRDYLGDSKAYLKWICDFFHMYNGEEKKEYDNEYKKYQKKFGWSDEILKTLKNEDTEFELPVKEIILSKFDSERAAKELENVNSEDIDLDERMKYFEEREGDKKDNNCKKCKKAIGKHNLYWHEGMCNECFFDENNM